MWNNYVRINSSTVHTQTHTHKTMSNSVWCASFQWDDCVCLIRILSVHKHTNQHIVWRSYGASTLYATFVLMRLFILICFFSLQLLLLQINVYSSRSVYFFFLSSLFSLEISFSLRFIGRYSILSSISTDFTKNFLFTFLFFSFS